MASEVVDLFTELAAILSPPGEERPVADAVTRYLRDLGLTVDEDDAGATVGSDMGNLYCRLEPTGNGGTPIFLCAHLDTVPPEGPLEPVIDDGVVRNAGGTILGSDNKAAVAVMLEATRIIVREGRRHAGVELLFTPSYGLSGGAADANVFNERGLSCLNLANGMQDIHTADERITVDDLEGMVEVTLALVDVAQDADA